MMMWNRKPSGGRVGAQSTASARGGLATVAAAWPTGVSQLAIAAAACQSCEAQAVCGILLGRVPLPILRPPSFCPYAAEITGASQATA
jgi:hypothetical protein